MTGGVLRSLIVAPMEQHRRIIDKLKTLEHLCLEMAQKSTLPLEQSALLEMAANCRSEAARCRTQGARRDRATILGKGRT